MWDCLCISIWVIRPPDMWPLPLGVLPVARVTLLCGQRPQSTLAGSNALPAGELTLTHTHNQADSSQLSCVGGAQLGLSAGRITG